MKQRLVAGFGSALVLCLSAAVIQSGAWAADEAAGPPKSKADFLSAKDQAFIRPGLNVNIERAWIDAGNVVKFEFTFTDSKGAPLDRSGVLTPGSINVRPVLAHIPAGQELYTAYTVRTATAPGNGAMAMQADRDRSGTVEDVAVGRYIYTFGTPLPADYDASTTHVIAMWANRDLEEYELGEQGATGIFHWVPDGSSAPAPRDVVQDVKCNACHGNLSAHDNRMGNALCVTCHQPQSTDPDTGNTVDFTVMVHKIHMGANLPSVQAGTPYQIIGFRQSVHDYSNVIFPGDVRACEMCHTQDLDAIPAAVSEGSTARISPLRGRSSRAVAARAALSAEAPAQAIETNHHLLRPSRRACGSCHDNVNFATGENHAGLPQISDNQCGRCHAPQGELEFDLSILGSHTIPRFSKELGGVNFEVMNVANTSPGQNPTVTFQITNDNGDLIAPSAMSRLAIVLAGGNGVDFDEFYSENGTTAEGGGPFTYTFEAALPDDATGRWAIGLEGYQNATLLAGTEQERTLRDAGENDVLYFTVNGGPTDARRAVVSQQKCDSCHLSLTFHGDNRNAVEHCVLCHNPQTTDVRRRPEDAGAPEGVNFKDMIHKIHTGEHLTNDLTIYGFGGRPHNYNEVVFPNDLANCSSCHIDGTERLPLPEGALASVAPRDLIDPAPPATAACLSCHTRVPAAAHADLNISPNFGESCDVCHGEGAEFSVEKVHAR